MLDGQSWDRPKVCLRKLFTTPDAFQLFNRLQKTFAGQSQTSFLNEVGGKTLSIYSCGHGEYSEGDDLLQNTFYFYTGMIPFQSVNIDLHTFALKHREGSFDIQR